MEIGKIIETINNNSKVKHNIQVTESWTGRWDGKADEYDITIWYEQRYNKPYKISWRIYNRFNSWEKEYTF